MKEPHGKGIADRSNGRVMRRELIRWFVLGLFAACTVSLATWWFLRGPYEVHPTMQFACNGYATGVAFSPDGSRLAVAVLEDWSPQRPGGIQVWDRASGEQIAHLRPERGMLCTTFSGDGRLLVAGSSWARREGAHVFVFAGREFAETRLGPFAGLVTDVAVCPGNRFLAARIAMNQRERTQLCVWRLPDLSPVATVDFPGKMGSEDWFRGRACQTRGMAFVPGEDTIAVIVNDKWPVGPCDRPERPSGSRIRFFDLNTKTVVSSLEMPEESAIDLDFSGDGRNLLVSTGRTTVRLRRDFESNKYTRLGGDMPCECHRFVSGSPSLFLCRHRGRVGKGPQVSVRQFIWDNDKQTIVANFHSASQFATYAIDVSGNGRYLLTGGYGEVNVFEIPWGRF